MGVLLSPSLPYFSPYDLPSSHTLTGFIYLSCSLSATPLTSSRIQIPQEKKKILLTVLITVQSTVPKMIPKTYT